MHWHLAYCASISETAFSCSLNGRHRETDRLVHVLLELQGALVSWLLQAHLEDGRKLLPIKYWMKTCGRAREIEIAWSLCHKLGIEVIILAIV